MRLGVGRWVQIQATGLLPGKMVQQLNGQTQRLLGQQSLAAYTGLQVRGLRDEKREEKREEEREREERESHRPSMRSRRFARCCSTPTSTTRLLYLLEET